MATKTAYMHGEFCWVDLATTDPAAAKRFYGGLFGWSFNDMPAGESMTYTMCSLRNQRVAGLYQLDAARQSQGIPPHRFLYIGVTNADETAKKVGKNNGKWWTDRSTSCRPAGWRRFRIPPAPTLGSGRPSSTPARESWPNPARCAGRN